MAKFAARNRSSLTACHRQRPKAKLASTTSTNERRLPQPAKRESEESWRIERHWNEQKQRVDTIVGLRHLSSKCVDYGDGIWTGTDHEAPTRPGGASASFAWKNGRSSQRQ